MEMTANKILADSKSVRQVLDKIKYSVDFFQREYRWERKHIEQLLSDLEMKFLLNYEESHERKQVQSYSNYYLGSIVLSLKDGQRSIIDGQQRLTSLTLLLIYLNNLQKDKGESVNIKDLIFSERYAEKSYNIQVEDRKECIDALYTSKEYDASGKGESIRNLLGRYGDIEEFFPEELSGKALPFFIDWLIDNVIFVEIVTYSDEDAYTIFETMNDRGLNLTPTEMLKGYLISNISDDDKKFQTNELWKNNISNLVNLSKEEDLEFFKAWLRAKYAETIRPGKKGAANEDFEKIGTRFHNWVRDNKERIGLRSESDFFNFVKEDFDFFVKVYLKILDAEENLRPGLEHIYYVYERGFTLHLPLLLAPIKKSDIPSVIQKKLALVSRFIDAFIVFRSINYRTLAYSSIRYTMFSLVKDIRNKNIEELAQILKTRFNSFEENLSGFKDFGLHQQNKHFVQFLLARITRHIEERCGIQSRFEDYMNPEIKKPFQIEHVWADNFDAHRDEFDQRTDFDEYRNKLGALILLPEGFNQSYGKLPYEEKLPHYFGQNLLAKTLSPQCYEKNPAFIEYMNKSQLPFQPHEQFKKQDIDKRQSLYQKISEEIWNTTMFEGIPE
jgi:uncharacterized protein with ParB-like and HNH nuclease domain